MIETVADLSAISATYWQGKHVLPAAGSEIDATCLGRKSVNAENKSAGLKVGFINVTSLNRHIGPLNSYLQATFFTIFSGWLKADSAPLLMTIYSMQYTRLQDYTPGQKHRGRRSSLICT